jgi:hypothetical protein
LDRYKLFIDREGQDAYDEIDLALAECSHTFEADSAAVYRFQVICVGEGGEGPETPILRWQGSKPEGDVDTDGGGGNGGSGSGVDEGGVDEGGGGGGGGGGDEGDTAPTESLAVAEPAIDGPAAASANPIARTSISGRGVGSPAAARKPTLRNHIDLAKRAVAGSIAESSPLSARKLLAAKSKEESGNAAKFVLKEKKEYPAAKKWPTMAASSPTSGAGDEKKGGVTFGVRTRPQLAGGRRRVNDRVSYVMISRSRTIRGKKGGVRKAKGAMTAAAAETTKEVTPLERTIREEKEKSRLVLYMTTVGTVRQTYVNGCFAVRVAPSAAVVATAAVLCGCSCSLSSGCDFDCSCGYGCGCGCGYG